MGKVLITGGAGFIGSKIARYCIQRGLTVRVFDLVPPREGGAHEALTGSILDPYEVSVAARGCDYIIHTAAALGVRRTETKRLECLYINIQGTVNVLEAAVKEKIRKILFTSSSEVYGDGNGEVFTETSPLNPKSNYAITKLVGEEYLRSYQQRYGLEYSIVRFFSIYGEGQLDQFVVPRFVQQVAANESPTIYGDGGQIRSFCHVDDAARGAVLALLSQASNNEIFNIGNDSEPISVKQLADRVIKLSGKTLVPQFINFQNSDRNAEREIYKRIPSIEKAKKVLDYQPKIALDVGLGKMLGVTGKTVSV